MDSLLFNNDDFDSDEDYEEEEYSDGDEDESDPVAQALSNWVENDDAAPDAKGEEPIEQMAEDTADGDHFVAANIDEEPDRNNDDILGEDDALSGSEGVPEDDTIEEDIGEQEDTFDPQSDSTDGQPAQEESDADEGDDDTVLSVAAEGVPKVSVPRNTFDVETEAHSDHVMTPESSPDLWWAEDEFAADRITLDRERATRFDRDIEPVVKSINDLGMTMLLQCVLEFYSDAYAFACIEYIDNAHAGNLVTYASDVSGFVDQHYQKACYDQHMIGWSVKGTDSGKAVASYLPLIIEFTKKSPVLAAQIFGPIFAASEGVPEMLEEATKFMSAIEPSLQAQQPQPPPPPQPLYTNSIAGPVPIYSNVFQNKNLSQLMTPETLGPHSDGRLNPATYQYSGSVFHRDPSTFNVMAYQTPQMISAKVKATKSGGTANALSGVMGALSQNSGAIVSAASMVGSAGAGLVSGLLGSLGIGKSNTAPQQQHAPVPMQQYAMPQQQPAYMQQQQPMLLAPQVALPQHYPPMMIGAPVRGTRAVVQPLVVSQEGHHIAHSFSKHHAAPKRHHMLPEAATNHGFFSREIERGRRKYNRRIRRAHDLHDLLFGHRRHHHHYYH
jgi:hypothetical protein